jgi:NTE family protein
MADDQDNQPKKALVLSAGAPHSPLMAGALCAIAEGKKTFDIIFTSGAGALIGLLFVAPKGKSPAEALRGMVELGISDSIYYHFPFYRHFPVNYKAFFKRGPFTQPIHRFAQHFKLPTFEFARIPEDRTQSETKLSEATVGSIIGALETSLERRADRFIRFYNDLIDLGAAAITPIPPPGFWSKGLCEPLPFLEDLVDFDELQTFKGEFYVNAFTPGVARRSKRERGKSGTGIGMEIFPKTKIGPDQVRAAFAYPFIYAPVKIGGKIYFEGADRDPINFGNLLDDAIKGKPFGKRTVKSIVLIDILASLSEYLLREPRNLWDAFGISIMAPVVAHSLKELARFEQLIDGLKGNAPKFVQLEFKIPSRVGRYITDWSYSNMSELFDIGFETGKTFLNEHPDAVRDLPRA